MLQRHTGDSYGYRFEAQGKVLVYSHRFRAPAGADPEHTERFVQFFRDADLVIFDAMYSLADAISVKADWGHSSNVVGVELCQLAGARHLCLFHHEPVFDDAAIEAMLAETRRLEEITRGATRPARQRGLRRAGNRACERGRLAEPASARSGRIRLIGAALLLALVLFIWLQGALDRAAAGGLVRRPPVAVAAPGGDAAGDGGRDRPEEPARARPVALAAQRAGAAGARHPPRRAGGHRHQHPDARGRCAVARAPAGPGAGRGPHAGRGAARAAHARCAAGARHGRGTGRAGRGRHARSRRARRCAPRRSRCTARRRAQRRRRAAPALPAVRRAPDQHRRTRPAGRRLGPDLGRDLARRDPPHAHGGQHRRHAGAVAGAGDAARGAARAVAAPGGVGRDGHAASRSAG